MQAPKSAAALVLCTACVCGVCVVLLMNGGGGHTRPHPNPQGAAGEQAEQHSQAGKGQLGRRSGGLVVMSVYHKSGMWLAPRLINVLYGAGLVRPHSTRSWPHTHPTCSRWSSAEERCRAASPVDP